jgi:hypothetical protein
VKLSTLLELIGSGSILLVVGAAAILMGAGFGLSEAANMPLWVSFCGLGLLAAAAGYVLIDRGSDEAEVQVNKAMSPLVDGLRNPFVGMAVAILGGIVLQRLLRGKREVVVERSVEVIPMASPDNSDNRAATEAPAASPEHRVSHFLGEQLRSIGTVAAETAVAVAMQTLGVPSIRELLGKLLGPDKPTTEDERRRADRSQRPQQAEASARGSTHPSHNGFNYAEFGSDV